ncbi:MAG: nucleotidyltransferase family protein, partial [Deltaproteobacteria bacterium]|nr:nucleotidyltransferase family protein [Deltaproteobacteria bacterium]
FQPLRFLVLISELANTYHDVIDWAYFKAVTAQYKMQKLSFFTLRLAHEFLGTKVPNEIAEKKILGYDLLRDSIVNLLFRDVKRPHVMKIKYAFLLDSFSRILLSLLRPMLPGAAELRMRYNIPEGSKAVYAYYVLNPILLPILLAKRVHRKSGASL